MNVPTRINIALFGLLFLRCVTMHLEGPEDLFMGLIQFAVVGAAYFVLAAIVRWAVRGQFQLFTFKF